MAHFVQGRDTWSRQNCERLGTISVLATKAPLDIKVVANLILDWAEQDGIEVSPMKLQKLLFFCHADFLVNYSQPLFKQDFEAWDYGPVNPAVYQEFKKFGDSAISGRATAFDPITASTYTPKGSLSQEDNARLRGHYDFYRRFGAIALSELSHSRAGPWRQARSLYANGLNADRTISSDLITKFHRLFDS